VSKIGLDLLMQLAPAASGDIYDLFDPLHSVGLKKTIGSTNPGQVRRQIALWKSRLK
jgi:argininosuccinate lyase